MSVNALRRRVFARRALARQQPRVLGVLAQFFDGAASLGSRLQHSAEQPHETRREHPPLRRCPQRLASLPQRELAVERVRLMRQLPREVPRQRAEYQHSESPHIGRRVDGVLFSLQGGAHLGRRVRYPRAHLAHHRACLLRHAEVHQFHPLAGGVKHQNVLGFDVAMHESLAVHELECGRDLQQCRLGDGHRESSLRRDRLEQVPEWGLLLREHIRRRRLESNIVRINDGAVRREVVAEVELAKEILQFRRRLG